MRNSVSSDVTYKDVVVIGNGPSGISLSMMLAGNLPYLKSCAHPDELLAARLETAANQKSLAEQPLEHLASGLEGRSTNPMSLLFDALEHPYADIGMDLPSLIEWRYHKDRKIDHVVLGKGPPGGSWYTMDPNVLTLSLASWMSLPGLPLSPADISDNTRRASAGTLARYYARYVKEMNLEQYFRCGVVITQVEPINDSDEDSVEDNTVLSKKNSDDSIRSNCPLINAFNYIRLRSKCLRDNAANNEKDRKRPHENGSRHDLSPDRKIREIVDDSEESIDMTYFGISDNARNDKIDGKKLSKSKTCIFNFRSCRRCKEREKDCDNKRTQRLSKVSNSFDCIDLYAENQCLVCDLCNERSSAPKDTDLDVSSKNFGNFRCRPQNGTKEAKWLVHGYEISSGKRFTYSCTNLVLANGSSDLPNRLNLPNNSEEPSWVLYDLRTLEMELDKFPEEQKSVAEPVMIVGAGLSAADAVIATRFRSLPVLHVFRNKTATFDKTLPENMYPEYHKVQQMMLDGGSTYPLYRALPEHSILEIDPSNKTVTVVSSTGEQSRHKVSYVVILIGSRPNLSFLPSRCRLGVNKSAPVDCKSNVVDIDKLTYAVKGCNDGLYAMGPLAGDNFVRFIPGGALAIVSDLYTKNVCCC